MPNVSFQAPTDYSTELDAIERRRQYAQLLQQQGLQSTGGTESVGGWAIPKSPLESIGKAAQSAAGAYQQKQLDQQQKDVARQYQSDLADTLRQAIAAGTGTPASAGGAPVDNSGSEMAGPPSPPRAAVAPDRNLMAQILMQHPATQQTGLQQMMGDMNTQRLASVFGLDGAQSGGAGGGSPVSQATSAGIPKNVAMGLLLTDPTGKSLAAAIAKQSAPINVRPGGTVYIPGQGPQYSAPQANGAQISYQNGQPNMGVIPGATQAGDALGTTPLQQVTNPDQTISYLPKRSVIAGNGQQPAIQPQGMPPQGPGTTIAPSVSPADINAIQDPRERAAAMQALQQGNFSGAPTPQLPQSPQTLPQNRIPGSFGQTQDEAVAQAAQTEQAKKEAAQRAELTYAAPQARASVADATQNLQRMEAQARQIMQDPGINSISGIRGMIPNIPGTGAADTAAKLNSLKSQVGFSVLQAMREASKTGGALGAISDKENELLQRNLAALDTSQSPEALKKSLQQLIDYAQGAQMRIQNGYKDTYERNIGNQGMQPTQTGAVPIQSGLITNRGVMSTSPQDIADEMRKRGLIK